MRPGAAAARSNGKQLGFRPTPVSHLLLVKSRKKPGMDRDSPTLTTPPARSFSSRSLAEVPLRRFEGS